MKTYKGFKVLTLTDKGLVSPIAKKTYKHLGDWTKEVATPRMCSKGWHLWDTKAAADKMFRDYAGAGRSVLMFSAEGQGFGGRSGYGYKKSVYKSVRLMKLLKVHLPIAPSV
jgi:hypothetical protein